MEEGTCRDLLRSVTSVKCNIFYSNVCFRIFTSNNLWIKFIEQITILILLWIYTLIRVLTTYWRDFCGKKSSRSDLKQQTQLGKITLKIRIRIRGKRRVKYTSGNDCRHPNSYFHSSDNVYFGEQFRHFLVGFNHVQFTRPKRQERII